MSCKLRIVTKIRWYYGSSSIHPLSLWTTTQYGFVPDRLDLPHASKPFQFEEMWLTNKGCSDTVQAVWASLDYTKPSLRVIQKIDKCGVELKKWSKKNFGNVGREIELKKKILVEAENEAMITRDNTRVRDLLLELNTLTDRETRMWLQRSKVLWATHGDKIPSSFTLELRRDIERILL